MLSITIPDNEFFDENTQEFITVKGATLQLEHSLISLKKWEQKWHKPFLDDKKDKTLEETIDYVRCMTITPNVKPDVYKYIPNSILKEITDYIKDPMTATWFNDKPGDKKIGAQNKSGQVITAEVIYCWMIQLGIPVEFEKWHLNQLLTLVRVVSINNNPGKTMSKREWASQRSALNAARRAKSHSAG